MPIKIVNCVLQYDPNSQERERYNANLKTNNYKHKLCYVIDNVELDNSEILSCCLYTDVNNI